MSKSNVSQMTLETAKQIVDADSAARAKERVDRFTANAAALAKSPTTQKVGIAALGAGIGAGLYALLAS